MHREKVCRCADAADVSSARMSIVVAVFIARSRRLVRGFVML
jgi:hypothetical protein